MIKVETSHLNVLLEGSLPVYQKILNLPFILELTKGTLSAKRFANYIQQDALYLVDYARALLLIAAKANSASEIVSFIKFAEGAIVEERALHEYYLKGYEIDLNVSKNNACFAYTHYLISTASTQSIEESVAAILPCFWIYRDVGNHIHRHSVINNPYEKWISNYANEEFARLVDEALLIADEMYTQASVSTQHAMRKTALQSSILEWRFWDDAYSM